MKTNFQVGRESGTRDERDSGGEGEVGVQDCMVPGAAKEPGHFKVAAHHHRDEREGKRAVQQLAAGARDDRGKDHVRIRKVRAAGKAVF
jgi:hypothetical protein